MTVASVMARPSSPLIKVAGVHVAAQSGIATAEASSVRRGASPFVLKIAPPAVDARVERSNKSGVKVNGRFDDDVMSRPLR